MNLSLKVNNNNYYFLFKEYLDIVAPEDNIYTLRGIDEFTKRYTTAEILESVRRSNIIANEEIFNICELVITYYENEKIRTLKAHTLDDIDYLNFNELFFLISSNRNKEISARINDYFSSKKWIPEDLKEFSKTLKNASSTEITNCYARLSYASRRLLKDYVYDKVLKKEKEPEKVLKKDDRME